MPSRCLLAAGLFLASCQLVRAQGPATPPSADPRFKVDLLLIVAHPDDDTLAGTYLAKIRLDQGRKVAVVFATRGDAGGNQVGAERASSLGLVREQEARADLATLGIETVWFLGGRDTPTQNPLVSLANWDHGHTLAEAVRIVRLTRPDVILTWLPMPVVGENHGDHQAASILATEAFDFAADPTFFPSQVARSVSTFEPRLENLQPWQPRKLYFMSDAADTGFMEGHGPSYSIKEVSSSRKVPFWQIALEQLHAHRTQFASQYDQLMAADPGTRERLITANPGGEGLIEPLRFVRGKSVVGGRATDDVFEGIARATGSAAEGPGDVAGGRLSQAAAKPPAAIELGSQWQYYRQFWRAHGLTDMPPMDAPAIGPFEPDQTVRVPIRVLNSSGGPIDVTLTATLPAGWKEEGDRPAAVRLASGGDYTFESQVRIGSKAPDGPATLRFDAGALGAVSVRVVVKAGGGGLPQ